MPTTSLLPASSTHNAFSANLSILWSHGKYKFGTCLLSGTKGFLHNSRCYLGTVGSTLACDEAFSWHSLLKRSTLQSSNLASKHKIAHTIAHTIWQTSNADIMICWQHHSGQSPSRRCRAWNLSYSYLSIYIEIASYYNVFLLNIPWDYHQSFFPLFSP